MTVIAMPPRSATARKPGDDEGRLRDLAYVRVCAAGLDGVVHRFPTAFGSDDQPATLRGLLARCGELAERLAPAGPSTGEVEYRDAVGELLAAARQVEKWLSTPWALDAVAVAAFLVAALLAQQLGAAAASLAAGAAR